MHMSWCTCVFVCVCVFVCDICLTVAAVAVFITLCIRDRPPFRHYIISPDQHVSLHCTGCHKSDKLEIHTLCCPPPPHTHTHTCLHPAPHWNNCWICRHQDAHSTAAPCCCWCMRFWCCGKSLRKPNVLLSAILHFLSARVCYSKDVLIFFFLHAICHR